MSGFSIGHDITVGPGGPVLVIPEIGINHGGSLEVALRMVDAAHDAGARLVKHQTHIVADEMSAAARSVIPGNSAQSIFDVMEQCALSEDEEREMMRYTESKGMVFLSTPFSRAAADRLEKFGVAAYKIGSGELNNYPLIKHIAAFKKPMILSTGMNDIAAIEKAVDIAVAAGAPYALLHTTNLYPTQPGQVRLGAMQQLMRHFPGVAVGLSDHTLNNNACIAAMGLGATVVERHFTDSKARVGNDIVCSMDPAELKALLLAAQEVPQMLGGEKAALPEEQVTIDFAYASVVSIRPIKKGEAFTPDNIWVKRPGTGEILAERYEQVLGRHALCDIENDVHIGNAMVAW
ncbi:MAG: N-acetylneuraminate synthase family protein [Oscillospiraceae bacterium]